MRSTKDFDVIPATATVVDVETGGDSSGHNIRSAAILAKKWARETGHTITVEVAYDVVCKEGKK